jgi:hypothetical protein
MNKENIYFMAKQVGIDSVEQYDSDTSPIELLERFAKLVAQHEREACAQVCEDLWGANGELRDAVEAIRARGNHDYAKATGGDV